MRARPPTQALIAFIDDHREAYGVEPICKAPPIAPSTYHEHAARRRDPDIAPARVWRDAVLRDDIRRAFDANFRVYGVRKVWRQLQREGETAARCTVARLMRDLGLQGAVRGKRVKTTFSDKSADYPLDKVRRQFKASRPNALWVSDFTYAATEPASSTSPRDKRFAFALMSSTLSRAASSAGACRARRMQASSSTRWSRRRMDRRPVHGGGLVHPSDRGVQYVSIRYTERLVEAGLAPSAIPGAAWRPSSTLPWNGLIGTIIADGSNPSEICLPPVQFERKRHILTRLT